MEKKAEPSTKIKKRNKGIQGLNFGLNKINVTIANLFNLDLLYFSLIDKIYRNLSNRALPFKRHKWAGFSHFIFNGLVYLLVRLVPTTEH